jgi:hypothetical protein
MLQSNYEHLKKKFRIYNRNHEHFLKKFFNWIYFFGSILTWIRIRKHLDPDLKGAESESV